MEFSTVDIINNLKDPNQKLDILPDPNQKLGNQLPLANSIILPQSDDKDSSSDEMYDESSYTTLSMLPTSYYSSLLPHQKPQVRDILLSNFPDKASYLTIVDCTSHIGGDSIHFSNIYPNAHIYAIDIDEKAIKCFKDNIKIFNLDPNKFTIITDDALTWILKTKINADFYYFDPPWGGPKYYKEHKLHLYLSDKRIETIINTVFNEGLTNTILLKIPRNFDLDDFNIRVKHPYKIWQIKKLHKRKAISYSILIINCL